MRSKKILQNSAVLKIRVSDAADYSAEFDEYSLTNVRIVEKQATEPDMKSADRAELYFFPAHSKCVDKDGNTVPLPRADYSDMCVIHPGEDNAEELRVASVEYRDGASVGGNDISHVKITLR